MIEAEIATTDILGVQISALDMPTAVRTIEYWIADRDKQYVCFCTVHGIMEADKDSNFRNVLNGAGLCCPDGMPLVWFSRRSGKPQVNRVYGPDLMLELCSRSQSTGHRHYFYGGTEGVAERLIQRLTQRFPDLQVAGWYTPGRLTAGQLEQPETIARINDAQPDIIWVGLGCPKQEWWVASHRPMLEAPALLAVGAAFDFHSGTVKQAPIWMQRNGLEWGYRLSQDPRRLWRRYLGGNAQFALRIASSIVGRPR